MSDNKSERLNVELITKIINELARGNWVMEPGDPGHARFVKELSERLVMPTAVDACLYPCRLRQRSVR